jgi:rRNA biogenesis protein RRP5
MKALCQIVSVGSLALIVSLPNQLFAHVPITHISSRLTRLLETADEAVDEDGHSDEDADADDAETQRQQSKMPELFEIFRPGQYVRAVVTAVHAAGSMDTSGMERPRDGMEKASRRVELSLEPDKVNGSVVKADLAAGFVRFDVILHGDY